MKFDQLTRSLADSEYWLRKGKDVSGRQTKGILSGRHDQLKLMEEKYPAAFKRYASDLLDRSSKPFDQETLLAAIKDEGWAIDCEMADFLFEQAEILK